MNFYKSCFIALLALTLNACNEEPNVAHVAAVTPTPAQAAAPSSNETLTQSSANEKPKSVVQDFYTSSMPDTFTIPHNTCSQGEALQKLKKEYRGKRRQSFAASAVPVTASNTVNAAVVKMLARMKRLTSPMKVRALIRHGVANAACA
ncbi:MAG: hypothetical protein ACK4RS_01585 [Thiothrix sp.]